MANEITCTAAQVRPLQGCVIRRFVAGAAIDVGAAVYIVSDGEVEEATGAAALTSWANGICVSAPNGATAAAAGDTVDVVVEGPVAGYSSMTPGTLVYVHDTAGVLSTVAGTKDFIVGYAESAGVVYVRPETIDLT